MLQYFDDTRWLPVGSLVIPTMGHYRLSATSRTAVSVDHDTRHEIMAVSTTPTPRVDYAVTNGL